MNNAGPNKPHLLLSALAIASLITAGLVGIYFVMTTGSNEPEPRPYEPSSMLFDQPIPVANYQLTDHNNRPFYFNDVKGSIVVADFFFTTCRSFCPMMTREMSKLQDELKASNKWQYVRLMSTSVDPATDTPQVLREYAARFDADLLRWTFVTGRGEAIKKVATEQFLLNAETDRTPDSEHAIVHSAKFVLIDPEGQIRGYYDHREPTEMEHLRKDLDLLLLEYRDALQRSRS